LIKRFLLSILIS